MREWLQDIICSDIPRIEPLNLKPESKRHKPAKTSKVAVPVAVPVAVDEENNKRSYATSCN
ncbi:unnamed protein product [Citrullus colocynthis]|uniref:Uncharacterized protein n=1 Tax=Citrullus colocynthis TaxID=252529 RepID=A0ABP0Z1Y4_9ROSI